MGLSAYSPSGILSVANPCGECWVNELNKRRVLEYLADLTEAAIGELPFQIIEIVQVGTDYRFALEHVTDGEVAFSLPIQVIYLHDNVVQILLEQEIDHILDCLWGRC